MVNDLVEEATGKIWHIANRARQGLDPEPGQVPEAVVIEDVSESLALWMQSPQLPHPSVAKVGDEGRGVDCQTC